MFYLKKIVALSVVVLLCLAFFAVRLISNSGELSGKWRVEQENFFVEQISRDGTTLPSGILPAIEFSGKSFTITMRGSENKTIWEHAGNILDESEGRMPEIDDLEFYITRDEYNQAKFEIEATRNRTSTSTRERAFGFPGVPGNARVDVKEIYRFHTFTAKGRYSITDDKIEFVHSDGKIVTHPFSRTENTLTIGLGRWEEPTRFIRQ